MIDKKKRIQLNKSMANAQNSYEAYANKHNLRTRHNKSHNASSLDKDVSSKKHKKYNLDEKTKNQYAKYGNGKSGLKPKAPTSAIYRFYPSNKLIASIVIVIVIILFVFVCYLSGKTQPKTNPTTNTTQQTSPQYDQKPKHTIKHANLHFSTKLSNLGVPGEEKDKLVSIYDEQNPSAKDKILHQIHIYDKQIPNLATRRLTIMNYLNNLKQQLYMSKHSNQSNNGNGLRNVN